MNILTGEKPDGIWKFSSEDISDFLSNSNVKKSIEAKNKAIVYDFILNYKKEPSMCQIYDFPVLDDEEAMEINEIFCNLINSSANESIQYSFRFNDKNQMVRVIFTGLFDQIYELTKEFYSQY